MEPIEFQPSALGNKEYWNQVYFQELSNYHQFQDEGQVWFGIGSNNKMVDWVVSHVDKRNGKLLLDLQQKGFKNLTGIDSSPQSIELCTLKATLKDNPIFACVDMLQKDLALSTYHLILDKGTFDAISLSSIIGAKERYLENIKKLLDGDGLVLITSCNWTCDELVLLFEGFTLIHTLSYPTFSFGGKSGQRISSLVFRVNTKFT